MNAALIKPQRSQLMSVPGIRVHCDRMNTYNQPADHRGSFSLSPVTPWPDVTSYRSAAGGRSPDDRQAAYFVELLRHHLRRIDRRIAKCLRAIAEAETAGDIENIRGFRDLLATERAERRAVEILLENLRHRFRSTTSGDGF